MHHVSFCASSRGGKGRALRPTFILGATHRARLLPPPLFGHPGPWLPCSPSDYVRVHLLRRHNLGIWRGLQAADHSGAKVGSCGTTNPRRQPDERNSFLPLGATRERQPRGISATPPGSPERRQQRGFADFWQENYIITPPREFTVFFLLFPRVTW